MVKGGILLSRVSLGFSPTVYASGARTALYCSIAMLIVCLRNLQICCKIYREKRLQTDLGRRQR